MDQKAIDTLFTERSDTNKMHKNLDAISRRMVAALCLFSFLLGAPSGALAAVDYQELQEEPLDTVFRKLAPSDNINWEDEEELVGGGAPSIAKDMIWPLQTGIVRGLFNRVRSRGRRRHLGVDLMAPKGTPIHAVLGGTVEVVSNGGRGFRGYGKVIIVNHNHKLWTLYSHCSSSKVRIGQTVKQGDVIAAVGRTGRATANHLHFEVRNGNGYPLNPMKYLPKDSPLVMSSEAASRMYAAERVENASRRHSRRASAKQHARVSKSSRHRKSSKTAAKKQQSASSKKVNKAKAANTKKK